MSLLDKSPQKISSMFDQISKRYDFMNWLLSLGLDQSWRRFLVRQTNLNGDAKIADLACGTGDLSCEWIRKYPQAQVWGVDFSALMLEQARKKFNFSQIHWIKGDITSLDFPEKNFDAVSVGFGIRNVENLDKGLAEILRVLKPGASAWILEFTTPPNPVFRQIYFFYKKWLMPQMARLFMGAKHQAYQYLDQSIHEFPNAEAFKNRMLKVGFKKVRYQYLCRGVLALHQGVSND